MEKLIPALVVLLAAAGGFYYFYWMHTPQYAAGEIYQAVTKKDYQLFRERSIWKKYTARPSTISPTKPFSPIRGTTASPPAHAHPEEASHRRAHP